MLHFRNRGRPEDTLDLHCLHVDEALGALAEKLNYAKPGMCVHVSTSSLSLYPRIVNSVRLI